MFGWEIGRTNFDEYNETDDPRGMYENEYTVLGRYGWTNKTEPHMRNFSH